MNTNSIIAGSVPSNILTMKGEYGVVGGVILWVAWFCKWRGVSLPHPRRQRKSEFRAEDL